MPKFITPYQGTTDVLLENYWVEVLFEIDTMGGLPAEEPCHYCEVKEVHYEGVNVTRILSDDAIADIADEILEKETEDD